MRVIDVISLTFGFVGWVLALGAHIRLDDMKHKEASREGPQ